MNSENNCIHFVLFSTEQSLHKYIFEQQHQVQNPRHNQHILKSAPLAETEKRDRKRRG